MLTKEVINKLGKECGVSQLSDFCSAPADIDFYVKPDKAEHVKKILCEAGFILTTNRKGQIVGRRFENGELYILDLISDFNIYTDYIPFIKLSAKGSATLGTSKVLHACFKALCFNGVHKLGFVQEHWKEFLSFLEDKSNFDCFTIKNISSTPKALLSSVARASLFSRLIGQAKYRLAALGTGYSMAFIGPDGSGKSFFIDKMRLVGQTSVVYMGDWFFTFQRVYTFLITTIPSPWNRFLYVIYFIENLLRQFKVAVLRLRGHIVLIDRFPGTNRNLRNKGVLFQINWFTFRFFPKPDKIVFLYASPEVIHQRKQELSVEEIKELHTQLHQILAGTPHSVVNTETLDKSLNMLLMAAYNHIPQH